MNIIEFMDNLDEDVLINILRVAASTHDKIWGALEPVSVPGPGNTEKACRILMSFESRNRNMRKFLAKYPNKKRAKLS